MYITVRITEVEVPLLREVGPRGQAEGFFLMPGEKCLYHSKS